MARKVPGYTVTLEDTGHKSGKPRHVVRKDGVKLASKTTARAAWASAQNHKARADRDSSHNGTSGVEAHLD